MCNRLNLKVWVFKMGKRIGQQGDNDGFWILDFRFWILDSVMCYVPHKVLL